MQNSSTISNTSFLICIALQSARLHSTIIALSVVRFRLATKSIVKRCWCSIKSCFYNAWSLCWKFLVFDLVPNNLNSFELTNHRLVLTHLKLATKMLSKMRQCLWFKYYRHKNDVKDVSQPTADGSCLTNSKRSSSLATKNTSACKVWSECFQINRSIDKTFVVANRHRFAAYYQRFNRWQYDFWFFV